MTGTRVGFLGINKIWVLQIRVMHLSVAVFVVFGSSACLVDGNGSVSAPTMLKVKRL